MPVIALQQQYTIWRVKGARAFQLRISNTGFSIALFAKIYKHATIDDETRIKKKKGEKENAYSR